MLPGTFCLRDPKTDLCQFVRRLSSPSDCHEFLVEVLLSKSVNMPNHASCEASRSGFAGEVIAIREILQVADQ